MTDLRNLLVVTAIAGTILSAWPAAAQTAVKIGVLNDRSGLYADLSGEGSVVAARMAVEDFDAAAKGLQVQIISADHQNKPDVGAAITRQWYDVDHVDAVFDVPTSSVALAVNQITKEKNKVFVDSAGGTSDLTGVACTPNTIHWTYDTWALGNGTGGALVMQGGDTWSFITADYAFGRALERDTSEVVKKAGGRVLGSFRHPLSTADFSSILLQAQGSKSKVVGLANAGTDTVNAIKQASEFGITQGGQTLAGLLVFINDVHALGLQVSQGLVLTEAFYWDQNDETRAFSKRFGQRFEGKMPTMAQAGVYSGVLHYLKAVAELKNVNDGAKVVARMKSMPTDDPLFGKGSVRADGRKIHPMYLFEVKKPSESKGEWDLYKLLNEIPADKAFRPLSEGGCPLVTKS